ncbi:MAG TPA: TolC family protein [Vicinamibacterales bacterium]
MMCRLSFRLMGAAFAAVLLLVPMAAAQTAVPTPASGSEPFRVTFNDAVALAIKNNPSVEQAAQDILRAQALLDQATALTRPVIAAGVAATFLNQGQSLNGSVTTAQNQVAGTIAVSAPLIAPVQWALRVQSADSKHVVELAAVDVRKQVAVSSAQACLSIMALRRVLEANERAQDVARAHYEFARQRQEAGAGSRLNELRAQQSLSSDESLVELSRSELYRAQEALGILLALDGPADVIDEPTLEAPASIDAAIGAMASMRTDLRLLSSREQALTRIVSDSWKEWLPSVSGLFQPQALQPATLFQSQFSWRAQVVASIPVFDFGYRGARKAERQVNLDEIRIAEGAATRQARSEVRTAQEEAHAAERALAHARAAADQAHEVVEIVNVSFRVGASTNIEVIDAQRVARDADTAVAVAEHGVRQARLSLLVALGLFPQNRS